MNIRNMPDSESEPDKPHGGRRQSTLEEASPFVPQITLTEAIDDNQAPPQQSSLLQSLPSPGSLSPTLHRPPSTPTLPLTRDILTRKNKLDKLLHNAAARSRRQQQQQPAMIYSLDSDSIVDERITAGLGITPPAAAASTSDTDADRSSNKLRHRRHATQSSNNLDEKTTPRSSENFRWELYDFDQRKCSYVRTSVNENMMAFSNMSSAATTASKRNSIAKVESPSPPNHYQPPPPPRYSYFTATYRTRPSRRNRFSLLDMLLNAAARVVNLRDPETAGLWIEHQEQQKKRSMHRNKRKQSNDQKHDAADQSSKRFSGYSASSFEKHSAAGGGTNYVPASPLTGSVSIPDHRSINTDQFAPSVSLHTSVKSIPPCPPSPSPPPHHPQHQLYLRGRSLCVFSPQSRIRQFIWETVLQWRYTELLLLFLILLQYFLLICVPIYENAQKTQFGGQWTHYAIFCIQVVYTFEAICKVIAYGLFFPPNIRIGPSSSTGVKSRLFRRWHPAPPGESEPEPDTQQSVPHTAYMNGFANAIDFVSIISYWIDLGLMVNGYPNCSVFKALGAARPLRLLSLLPGTATILRSLQVSWDMLKDVIGFIFFFLLLFALVGLISFQGAFSRKCYAVADNGELSMIDPPLYCSGYYNGSTVVGAYNPITGSHSYQGRAGYYCSNGQVCLELDDHNPNYGFVNFDTIYYAILNVYTFVSLELWTDLMYQNMDGDSKVSALYYCLGVYVISFILIFLIFAVITSGFSRVRAESKVSAFTGKKKQARLLRPVQVDEDNDEYIWKFEDADRDHTATSVRLKRALVKIVKSRVFFYFGGFMVLLDTIFMCLRSVHASESTLEMIDNAETAFTFFFALEILVRMAGATTWMQFWNSGRNKFDLLLVIVTCIIQLPMIQDSAAYKYLTIFQCLRMYRLFICIPRVRRLLSAALGTGESVINVVGFLLLATALCAPIFMELFGGDFNFIEPDDTELRCDTFWQSFLTLIMLYTSETWTEFLYNAMESQPGFSAVYAAIFTSIYLAFGRYIMSGLYIAVILENFELEDEEIKQYQIRQFIHRRVPKPTNRLQAFFDRLSRPLFTYSNKKHVQIRHLPSSLTARIPKSWLPDIMDDDYVQQQLSIEPSENKIKSQGKIKSEGKISKWLQSVQLPWRKKQMMESSAQSLSVSLSGDTLVDDTADDYDLMVAEENRRAKEDQIQVTKSLLVFSPHSKFRCWCKKLVGSSANGQAERRNLFNWFIMLCVLMSILIVILDEPSTRRLRQDTQLESSMQILDLVLSIVFLVEIGIRIIADGLIVPPEAYLRNSWNRLDFVVVVLNFIAMFTGTSDLPRALGTVRSLRILRLIRYFSGMRDVFVDLFHAFPLMLDALLLVFLVMVFFSVYGINILGGRMVACNDDSVSGRSSCIGEFQMDVGTDEQVNIYQPRVWAIPDQGLYSYDDFPAALAQLFSLSSTEGWIDSLFYAMSAPPEPDLQPSFDWDSEAVFVSIFYVIFMVISHGTLQLFVGVIIEKFKQRAGISTMTIAQRQYADLKRQLAELKPTPKPQRPTYKIGQICYDLVANKRGPFNKIMMWVIILNICVIASEFQNEPFWLQELQDFTYLAFIIVYVAEVIVKYIGLGWVKWSRSKWNWYDAFIACSALILATLRFAVPDLWTLRIERYCLIFAAFRLGEGIDSLQTLYHTVRISLPKIVRVTAVFLLVMCLFAMVFMELFGLTKYGEETGKHSNFRDYGNALLLLIRVTTGEAWNVIMMDYTVQAPKCVASDDYLLTDCGSPGWAYFMFNLFYLICTHIFLNLFTATVVSNFEYAYETRSRFTRLTKDDLRNFKYAWREVDPSGSGFIQRKDVIKFLSLLKGRFQVRIYDDSYSVSNLKKLLKKTASSALSPRLDEKISSMIAAPHLPMYDTGELCRRLSRLDEEEIQERRRDFNMCYLEIISMETSKGISFDDVRTIMSYRFFDVEEALHIDALIQRLEKLDQLRKMYASEKAMGVFLTMAQRKRYLHQLWQKKNEEEFSRLAVPSSPRVGLKVDTSVGGLHPQSAISQRSPSTNSKQCSPVPTIVIQDAPPSPRHSLADNPPSPLAPLSPLSNYSFDTQLGSPGGGGDSLSTTAGSNHAQASPYPGTITDSEEFYYIPASPSSPSMLYSPASPNQRWRLIDSNTQMAPEVAGNLMESMRQSPWSDLLHEESLL